MVRLKNMTNLKTEKDGIIILNSMIRNFIVPSVEQKKYLYNIADINYATY